MRRFIAFIGRVVPTLLKDGAGLAGCGLVSYGAWLMYEPAGFIVAGVLLLATSVLLNLSGKAKT